MGVNLQQSVCQHCAYRFMIQVKTEVVPDDQDTSGIIHTMSKNIDKCEKGVDLMGDVNDKRDITITQCQLFRPV